MKYVTCRIVTSKKRIKKLFTKFVNALIYSRLNRWVLKGQNVFEQIQIFRSSGKCKFEEREKIIFYLVIYIYSTRSLCNFYIFIENEQLDVDDGKSRLLGTEVNGEIHIISFLGKFTKLCVKYALVNVKSHQEFKKIQYNMLVW